MGFSKLKYKRLAQSRMTIRLAGMGLLAIALVVLDMTPAKGQQPKKAHDSVILNLQPYRDATGYIATYSSGGNIDSSSAFFQSLGTNGRSCSTCHLASQAFSFSARAARERFEETNGTDPLFASIDGANCPNAHAGDKAGHSLLLTSGLIRIPLPAPTNSPQFSVQANSDPYGCAVDTSTGQPVLSFYRRPLPTTNIGLLSAIMFDGRESAAFPLNNPSTFQANLMTNLTTQALHAIQTHAQAAVNPTANQLADIVNLELGFSTAQIWDNRAGALGGHGGNGGPAILSQQSYYPGINDSLTPSIFTPTIFTLYGAWTNASGGEDEARARATIAAGEQLFNSFPISITSVRGINDNAALGKPAVITGTCGTCHDTPNVGNHSLPLPLDIGTGHSAPHETNPQIKNALAQLSFPNLPVYQISGCTDPFTGETTLYTTDLGKATLTGQCVDLNRVKGPVLRGLAARAPYFHNGAAANLNELVNFYNQRFNMGLTNQQAAELIAFLNSL